MAFGGKKAAPFVSGGGRKKSSTKTAKGKPKTPPPGKGKGSNAKAFSTAGTSPSTAIGGGQFVAKGKKRRSANVNPSMGGQAGMQTSNQAGR